MTELEAKFNAEYSQYLSNFKTLSYDSTNDEYLCQNTTHKYYNFDKIVEKRCPKPTPSSPDTLIFKDKKIYCVEFKNSFKNNINTPNIKKKLKCGHKVLLEIFMELGLKIQDYKLIFCVVYKAPEDYRDYKNHIEKQSIHFDLEQYVGEYFDDIITNNVDFFRDQFIKKIDQNLPC